ALPVHLGYAKERPAIGESVAHQRQKAERVGLSERLSGTNSAPFPGWYRRKWDGGDHATHHLFSAADRHLDMLDGERGLASQLHGLRIVAPCRCMLRSLHFSRDFSRRTC